jgi:hypothetical protein
MPDPYGGGCATTYDALFRRRDQELGRRVGLLGAGNIELDTHGGLDRVNRLTNAFFEPAKLRPVVRAQNQECEGSIRPVLLIPNSLVARDQ